MFYPVTERYAKPTSERRPAVCASGRCRSRRRASADPLHNATLAKTHSPLGPAVGSRRSYDDAVTSPSYLRFPHVHGDLLTFVAEDDVWLAPAAGGRAWRLSADR